MALGKAVLRLAKRLGHGGRAETRETRIDEAPRSAYELVTRRALDDLTRDFERLETKVNGLSFGVVLTFGVEVWKSFR
jgi:hypothetical protein